MATFRLHDYGSMLENTLTEAGVAKDISDATIIRYEFLSPTEIRSNANGSFATTGSDGRVRYVFTAGQLNETGTWRYQVYIETPAGAWRTGFGMFSVSSNLIVSS